MEKDLEKILKDLIKELKGIKDAIKAHDVNFQNTFKISMKHEVLKRIFDFRLLICNATSKVEIAEKKITVAKCQAAREALEDFEENILNP